MTLKVADSKEVSIEKQFLGAVERVMKINQALSTITEKICDIDEKIACLSNSIPGGEAVKKKLLQFLKNCIRLLKAIKGSDEKVRRHLIPVYKSLCLEKDLKHLWDDYKTLLTEKRVLFKAGKSLGQQKFCLFEEMANLCHQGVNVNVIYVRYVKPKLVDGTVKKVSFKYSPLELAARGGDLELVKYLIYVCDADVSQCRLTVALDYKYLDVVQFLKSRLSKFSAKEKTGKAQSLSEQKSNVRLPLLVKQQQPSLPKVESNIAESNIAKKGVCLPQLGGKRVAKMRGSLFSRKAVVDGGAGFGGLSVSAKRLR